MSKNMNQGWLRKNSFLILNTKYRNKDPENKNEFTEKREIK